MAATKSASTQEDKTFYTIDDTADSGELLDEESASVSSGNAVTNTPGGSTIPYSTSSTLTAESLDYTELLTSIDVRLEEQNLLLQEQNTFIGNGVIIIGMGFGLTIGALVALGLWKGRK